MSSAVRRRARIFYLLLIGMVTWPVAGQASARGRTVTWPVRTGAGSPTTSSHAGSSSACATAGRPAGRPAQPDPPALLRRRATGRPVSAAAQRGHPGGHRRPGRGLQPALVSVPDHRRGPGRGQQPADRRRGRLGRPGGPQSAGGLGGCRDDHRRRCAGRPPHPAARDLAGRRPAISADSSARTPLKTPQAQSARQRANSQVTDPITYQRRPTE